MTCWRPLVSKEGRLQGSCLARADVFDVVRALSCFLPSWVSQWLGAYAQYAATCLLLAGIMGRLIISGKRVAHAIDNRMTALWRRAVTPTLRALNIAPSSASTRGDLILMGLRSGWRHYLSPALPVLAIAYLGITVGNRLVFTAVDQAGLFLQADEEPRIHPGCRCAGLV